MGERRKETSQREGRRWKVEGRKKVERSKRERGEAIYDSEHARTMLFRVGAFIPATSL